MQEHIEKRLARPVRTPEQAADEALSCAIRAKAAQISSIAQMVGTFNHARLGTPEARQTATITLAAEIMEMARRIDPGCVAPRPLREVKWAVPCLDVPCHCAFNCDKV